jgi:hypothetical protein
MTKRAFYIFACSIETPAAFERNTMDEHKPAAIAGVKNAGRFHGRRRKGRAGKPEDVQ